MATLFSSHGNCRSLPHSPFKSPAARYVRDNEERMRGGGQMTGEMPFLGFFGVGTGLNARLNGRRAQTASHKMKWSFSTGKKKKFRTKGGAQTTAVMTSKSGSCQRKKRKLHSTLSEGTKPQLQVARVVSLFRVVGAVFGG